MSKKIELRDIGQAVGRREKSCVVKRLVRRLLAHWIVKGEIAQMVDVEAARQARIERRAAVAYVAAKAFRGPTLELNYSADLRELPGTPLPAVELPGVKFVEPKRRPSEGPGVARFIRLRSRSV